jgi:phosphatidylserine/phosphatidylglycerophosphate/cardiolipin synthase-like enzyme
MIYYLAARPETVVSIVNYGTLPEELPKYIKNNFLLCSQTISDCFEENAIYPQFFILKLNIPEIHQAQKKLIFLEQLETNTIQQIFVYSQRGMNLLNRLFGGNCPLPIAIAPNIYPDTPQPSKKRPREEVLEEKKPESKRQALNKPPISSAIQDQKLLMPIKKNVYFAPVLPKPPSTEGKKFNNSKGPETFLKGAPVTPTISPKQTTNVTPLSKIDSPQKPINKPSQITPQKETIDRLSTYTEHLDFLQLALKKAKKTILITSFSINHETLLKANLYQLIPEARNRRVKIYIYYNDQKYVDPGIISFLKKHGVFCEQAYTHSKILAIDTNLVATGSFNWLSTIDSKYQECEEGSLVIHGDCKELVEDFWKYIKHYRHRQFAYEGAVRKFERNAENNSAIIYKMDETTELEYLPILDQQCGFFQECFDSAKQRLIICSPFISSIGQYEDDIDVNVLRKTTSRGVDIFFICAAESNSLESFRNFLSKVNSPKIHLIAASNIHLKTIIIDENLIAEGSFNWLSAARDDESEYHNHEQTISVRGDMAKELIEKFFQTRVGLSIQHEMQKAATHTNSALFFGTTARQPNPVFHQSVTKPRIFGGDLQTVIPTSRR